MSHIVVGTPGRVLDLLNQGALWLDKVRFLVLDEADEMLDRGFAPDVERILGRTDIRPADRALFRHRSRLGPQDRRPAPEPTHLRSRSIRARKTTPRFEHTAYDVRRR